MMRTTVLLRQLCSWPRTLSRPSTEITTKTFTSLATWPPIGYSHKGTVYIHTIIHSSYHTTIIEVIDFLRHVRIKSVKSALIYINSKLTALGVVQQYSLSLFHLSTHRGECSRSSPATHLCGLTTSLGFIVLHKDTFELERRNPSANGQSALFPELQPLISQIL